MLNKLKEVEGRFEEINSQLYDPEVVCDTERYSALMKEFKTLTPIVEKYREYKDAQAAFDEAKELLYESGLDKDFREMVQIEYDEGKVKTEALLEDLKILLHTLGERLADKGVGNSLLGLVFIGRLRRSGIYNDRQVVLDIGKGNLRLILLIFILCLDVLVYCIDKSGSDRLIGSAAVFKE